MSDAVRNTREAASVDPASPSERSDSRSDAGPSAEPGWRWRTLVGNAWQFPLLAAGVAGVAAAVWYARSNPPKHDFDGALAQASASIEAGDFGVAEHLLWSMVAPNLVDAPEDVRARFEAISADYLAARLRKVARPAPEDDARVVEAYEAARAAGWTLTEAQSTSLGASLARLGRTGDAIDVLDGVAAREAGAGAADELGRRLRREALVARLSDPTVDLAGRLASIEEYRRDPRATLEEQAFAAARAAETRLAAGSAREAADRILLDMRRLESLAESNGVEPAVLRPAYAELSALYAESMRREGRLDEALREFEQAMRLTSPDTPAGGAIDVGVGRVRLALGQPDEAEKSFDRAVLAEHRGPVRFDALAGRASARVAKGDLAGGFADYRAIERFARRGEISAAQVAEIADDLVREAELALAESRFTDAIEFGEVAYALAPGGVPASDLLRLLGQACRSEADRRIASTAGEARALATLEPGEQAEIGVLLSRAAELFARHADTRECRDGPAERRADALWASADSYDLAGRRDLALEFFELWLATAPADDVDRAAAHWRIATIHEAKGAYTAAVDHYEKAVGVSEEGPYAVLSVVPLARALAADGRSGEALRVLGRALDGGFGLRPGAEAYFAALDLHAEISFGSGAFARAAELLGEAIARRPDHPRLGELRFRLAECLMLVAREATELAAKGEASEARLRQLSGEARAKLVDARRTFEQAIVALSANESALDGLGRDMLRDAHLRRADCAYDLGDLDDAIGLYEAVDRKYPDHPSSLVALIQIVNASERLGDAARAATAHRRAQLRLAQLPDDVLLTGNGILSRASWEDWLRNRRPGQGALTASGAGADAEGDAP